MSVPANKPAEKVAVLSRDKRAAKQALVLESHKRNHFWVDLAPGVSQDDVRTIDFWANVAPGLRRNDLVTLVSSDQSWEMLVCVEKVRGDGAEVSVRKVHGRLSLSEASEVIDDAGQFVVEYRGPEGWCVRRLADGVLVVRNHAQKASAAAAWRSSLPRRAA